MTICRGGGCLVAIVIGLSGCGEIDASFDIGGHHYPADGLTQWALPGELREVSGLALNDDGRLFAHDDESAVVFELDYRRGRAVKRFALGSPPRAGDYEGIAWVGSTLYLVTSDGDLLAAQEGDDGDHVDYRLHRTGLGRRCEIEGLDYDRTRNLLLMACKTARVQDLQERIAVLAWSLADGAPAPEYDVVASWPRDAGGALALHPSALTRSSADGNFVLAAARQHALIELGPDGALISVVKPPRDRGHPQMEGLVMTPEGDLIIADEGRGKRGRLSVYAAAR